MPAGVAPPNFHGNKNSGRKKLPVELAKARAIISAWNKVANSIESEDVKGVALPIALKTMVDKHDVRTNVSINFDPVFNDTAPTSTEGSGINSEIQDN